MNWKVRRVFSPKNAVYNAVVEDLDWRVAGLLCCLQDCLSDAPTNFDIDNPLGDCR